MSNRKTFTARPQCYQEFYYDYEVRRTRREKEEAARRAMEFQQKLERDRKRCELEMDRKRVEAKRRKELETQEQEQRRRFFNFGNRNFGNRAEFNKDGFATFQYRKTQVATWNYAGASGQNGHAAAHSVDHPTIHYIHISTLIVKATAVKKSGNRKREEKVTSCLCW